MSIVTVPDNPGVRGVLGETPSTEIAPSPWGPAFRQANTVVSALYALNHSGPFTPDPNFDKWAYLSKDGPKYLADHSGKFVGASSQAEVDSIKGRIDQENADRRALEANGAAGHIVMMLAGMADPTIALPVGNVVKAAKEGYSLTRSAISIGAAGAAQAAVQESVLQASQETRPLAESAIGIGSATLLSAIIGAGAAKMLSRSEHAAMTRSLQADREAMTAHAAGEPPPATVTTGPPPGFVRMYHGADGAETLTGGGGRWLTPDPEYARNFRTAEGQQKQVFYVDIPKDSPLLRKSFDDTGTDQVAPYVSFEAPEEIARNLKPYGAPAGAAERAAAEVPVAETPAGEAPGGLGAAAGAAATDTRALEVAPYGLDKVPGVRVVTERMNPLMRVFTGDSTWARRHMADLAEFPGRFRENLEGVPTSQGPSVERLARMQITQERVAVGDELTRLFSEYRFGAPDVPLAKVKAGWQDWMGDPGGKMTFSEFKQEVSTAWQNAGRHEIPQVEQAAQFIAKKLEPWAARAEEAVEGFKRLEPKEGEGYFPHLWNKQKIAAERDKFANWLHGVYSADQQTKAAAKARLEGFSEQLRAAEKRVEGARSEEAAVAATAERDAVYAKIEAEIAAWEGKSANEAKSAIKAREKYAADSEREAGAARLAGADTAIDRVVRRIIDSDRDLTAAELRSRAHETIDRILGSPDGRLPYDTHTAPPKGGMPTDDLRGPLASRQLDVSNAAARAWIEDDAEQVMATWMRTVVPDTLIAERFGDIEMSAAMRQVNEEFAALADAAKSDAARTKLEKGRLSAIEDLAGVRDRIRGTYGLSASMPMRQAARVVAAVKNYNVLTSMGMAAISSLPDMAGSVFRYGLTTAFEDAWAPFMRGMMTSSDAWKQSKAQFRTMGIAVETTLASRHRALDDVIDLYKPQSRVERALQWGADKFQLANGLAAWTDWAKTSASMVAGSEILRAGKAVAEGKATAKQIAMLAENSINRSQAERIWKAFDEGGGQWRDGALIPNTAEWKDASARTAFEAAVSREADIAVVTPGQDKPFTMSDPILSIFTQFKSFTAASTQRMLIANLQRHDAQVLQGLIFSLSLGMLSYKVNSMLGGQPTSDKPADWIKEAISRGNLLGWFEEANALASKASGGKLDVYRAIGAEKPLSRYASRSALDQLLGPTAGKVDSLLKVSRATAKGEWNESDTHALRRLMATQNLFYLRGLFNQVEAGANNAFGIPMKERPPVTNPH